MKINKTKFKGVFLIELKTFKDNRGYFIESFNEKKFNNFLKENNLKKIRFIQDSHSFSHKNVLRGLHYQSKPYAQAKLVRVISGAVQDIVVNINPKSREYLKYLSFDLNDKNNHMLYISEDYAHGFLSLKKNTHFYYKVSKQYQPNYEKTLKWNDKSLSIKWNIFKKIILSKKDA